MKNLAISKKIFINMFLFCLIVTAVISFSLYQAHNLSNNVKKMDRASQLVDVYNMYDKKLALVNLRYLDAMLNRESGVVNQKVINRHHEFYDWVEENRDIFESGLTDEKSKSDFEASKKDIEELKILAERIFTSIQNKDSEEVFTEYDQKREEILSRILERSEYRLSVQEKQYEELSTQTLRLNSEVENVQLYSLIFVILLSTFMTWMLIANTKSTLKDVLNQLKENFLKLLDESNKVADNSASLSEASSEQASSLQETVASIDEISAMVDKNADTAARSSQVSAKSTQVASDGKKIVSEMVQTIGDISKSNLDIMNEMNQNNEEFKKIITVINEIGTKTQIINDIVFQTKLLSFNASVEAARAGEHGKGFAVVAEEVGNLAAMSGKAAQEITQMLERSIKQVVDIVESSKKNVEALVQVGKAKVELGEVKANECGVSLDEILSNVTSVNEMVNEIAYASKEQSQGVKEVTVAMQQLDQVTSQNTSIAQKSSVMADNLQQQASSLEKVIHRLEKLAGLKTDNEKPVNKEKHDRSKKNVIPFETPKKKVIKHVEKKPVAKKVSGENLSVPREDDPRFEDL